MDQELNYEQTENEFVFGGKEPYFFSPSITRTRTINGKTYIIRSYYIGGKDFAETIENLAIKQAYKNVR